MAPAGERVGELDEVLGAHQGGHAEDRPARLPGQQHGERARGGHHAEADAVVEPVQRRLRQPARRHRARHRQLGGEGRQHMAEEEDPGRTGGADPAFQGADDEGEEDPVRGVQPARDPQGARDEHDERLVGEVRGVGAGVAQQLVDGGLVAEVAVDRGGEEDKTVDEAEGGTGRSGEHPPRPRPPPRTPGRPPRPGRLAAHRGAGRARRTDAAGRTGVGRAREAVEGGMGCGVFARRNPAGRPRRATVCGYTPGGAALPRAVGPRAVGVHHSHLGLTPLARRLAPHRETRVRRPHPPH